MFTFFMLSRDERKRNEIINANANAICHSNIQMLVIAQISSYLTAPKNA